VKYDVVTQSLEEDFRNRWTLTSIDAIQFENVPFNSTLFEEYVGFTVRFGESFKRSLPVGCYRQAGLLIISVFVRPAKGAARKLILATAVAEMYLNAVIQAQEPLVAPVVKMYEPTLYDDNKDRDGWVMAQMSCPFYYDLEY
jgi:hypothetical protein